MSLRMEALEEGKLGRFLAWRSFGSLGPYYLMVYFILAWRRAHS
jgi:hypothetical protein